MFEKILYDCHCLVYKSYKLPAPLYTKKNLKQVRLCLLFRGLHACKPVGPAGKVASRSAAFVVGLRRRQVYKWKLYSTRLLPTKASRCHIDVAIRARHLFDRMPEPSGAPGW
jgi:hypothetical protein